MKRLFIASILLNVMLIGAAAYALWLRKAAPSVQSIEISATETTDAAPMSQSADKPVDIVAPVAAPEQTNIIQDWHQIESADYREYIENLRKIGCPEETIADIIISEVSELYRKQLTQLPSVPRREFKFWQTGNYDLYPRLDPALEKARRDIERERDELLRTLLGPLYATYKVPTGTAEKWMYDPFFAALPADKRSRVFDISDRYETAVKRIKDHRREYLDEDDWKELRRLRDLKDTELATVLSTQELEQFQARFSEEAEHVRKNILTTFDATEEEFRAIALAQTQIRDGNAGEMEQKIKQVLGDERYAEYKRSTDWEYRRIVQITKKQNLPREAAQKVYDMKAEIENAARNIRMDSAIPPDQKMQKLAELRRTAQQGVHQFLGEEGFKQFMPSAWWLRNLAPTPGQGVRPAAVIQQ